MSAKKILGKEVAASIRQYIKQELLKFHEKTGDIPGLAVVLAGEDSSSMAYAIAQKAIGESFGYRMIFVRLHTDVSQEEIEQEIATLNQKDDVHGILLQLPLPAHLNDKAVYQAVAPIKDVAGFHPVNIGNLLGGEKCLVPCTAQACMKLLEFIGYDLVGKHVVVVGRSTNVGKPISLLMLRQHATVTVCHSQTPDLAAVCKEADVLLTAVGEPGLINGSMIKAGAVVIDVGTSRENGKLCGDADDSVFQAASYVAPVPGGVAPLTITMLMLNTLEAFKRRHNLK